MERRAAERRRTDGAGWWLGWWTRRDAAVSWWWWWGGGYKPVQKKVNFDFRPRLDHSRRGGGDQRPRTAVRPSCGTSADDVKTSPPYKARNCVYRTVLCSVVGYRRSIWADRRVYIRTEDAHQKTATVTKSRSVGGGGGTRRLHHIAQDSLLLLEELD